MKNITKELMTKAYIYNMLIKPINRRTGKETGKIQNQDSRKKKQAQNLI